MPVRRADARVSVSIVDCIGISITPVVPDGHLMKNCATLFGDKDHSSTFFRVGDSSSVGESVSFMGTCLSCSYIQMCAPDWIDSFYNHSLSFTTSMLLGRRSSNFTHISAVDPGTFVRSIVKKCPEVIFLPPLWQMTVVSFSCPPSLMTWVSGNRCLIDNCSGKSTRRVLR